MREAQTADGLVPEIAPEYTVFSDGFRDSPEWGSTAVILPWYVYQWYGDKAVLMDNYSMMQRYVDYLEKVSDHLILKQGLGDWYDLGPKHPGYSQLTPMGVTGTAYYYYDLKLLAQIAHLLDKEADATIYQKRAEIVRKTYNDHFFNASTKQYATGSQTANAISVYLGLVNPEDKAAVVANIVKDLREHNNVLTAGDIGYRYLLKVLDDEGYSDVIFAMNNRSDVPGYGYQLAKGATALTESWQALPSVSNNHFMLGHIMEWFYAGLAGIRPAEGAVACNKIIIKPQPVGDVTSAKATYQCAYGTISTNWAKAANGMFTMQVQIPANTTAQIYLPAASTAHVTEGNQACKGTQFTQGYAVVAVGSGNYQFTVNP